MMSTRYQQQQNHFCLLLLQVLLLVGTVCGHAPQEHKCEAYEPGTPLTIQCKTSNSNTSQASTWGPGLICVETGKEITFSYGQDTLLYCSLSIPDAQALNLLKKYIEREENLNCRVKMAPDHDVYIPFTIPFWGIVEQDHVHINNHLNFVFHGDTGKVIGATIYPVRDRFQFATVGSVISLHGIVKFFHKHSFMDLAAASFMPASGQQQAGTLLANFMLQPVVLVISWSIITFSFSLLAFIFVYRKYLKPKVLRTVLKNE